MHPEHLESVSISTSHNAIEIIPGGFSGITIVLVDMGKVEFVLLLYVNSATDSI